MSELKPNEGKKEIIEVQGKKYSRMPVKTCVITEKESIPDVAATYVAPNLQPGDVVFISEKSVACSQKRAVPLKDIHPRKLARILSRFVYKSPYGIGLSMPETIEMALRECGTPRILFAAGISAVGKLFGRRGWFYAVAGEKAESIDGPTPYTLPPYNTCVVLGPSNPDQVAREVSQKIGAKVCIVDVNDLSAKILGTSHTDMDRDFYAAVLKDNPLRQSGQQTPMGIIREIH